MQLAIPCVKALTKIISLADILTFILLNLTYKVREDEDKINAFYDNCNVKPNFIGNLSLLLKIRKQIRRSRIRNRREEYFPFRVLHLTNSS